MSSMGVIDDAKERKRKKERLRRPPSERNKEGKPIWQCLDYFLSFFRSVDAELNRISFSSCLRFSSCNRAWLLRRRSLSACQQMCHPGILHWIKCIEMSSSVEHLHGSHRIYSDTFSFRTEKVRVFSGTFSTVNRSRNLLCRLRDPLVNGADGCWLSSRVSVSAIDFDAAVSGWEWTRISVGGRASVPVSIGRRGEMNRLGNSFTDSKPVANRLSFEDVFVETSTASSWWRVSIRWMVASLRLMRPIVALSVVMVW